jgi:hypothetical protein
MNRPWIIPTIVIALVIVLICCCCVIITLSGLLMIRNRSISRVEILPTVVFTQEFSLPTDEESDPIFPTPTPVMPDIEPIDPLPSPRPTPGIPPTTSSDPGETLKTLTEAEVPINDPADIARRLEGKTGISPTLEPPTVPPQVGDQESFWVSDTDTNENFQVQATLQYITDHSYFWIEDGVDYNQGQLRRLAEAFESKIYPTDREFFGSEWSPGVDGDIHLYILYARGLGSNIAGYFSSVDSLNPAIQEFSNGHEMFVFNADSVSLDQEYTYGVLAHEFQHMIHWYRDRNEETWLNEGLSDLAMFLNGYDIGGHDFVYALDPDIQLNDWPNDPNQTTPHYGASFLFVNYFLSRFGEQATQAVVTDIENGLVSIDKVLADLSVTDPLTGNTVTADDVFQDWVLTSFIQDRNVGDGRFIYQDYRDAPRPNETEQIRDCNAEPESRQVSQYGVDYILIRCGADTTLRFQGDIEVGVIPESAYSGSYAFWSNKGDESEMTLTQEFDFSDRSGPLTLQYWTWYDIEKDFDYLYLEASTDGENWEILTTPSGTDEDPTGANYGWGYNGNSGADLLWVFDEVDISKFAGQKVQIRFDYITDAAVNGEGFLLDDVAIPEIGYFSDFETDNGGWTPVGFVRIQNALPQTFRLALIKNGRQTTVEYISLSAGNTAEIPLQFGGDVDEVVLVVSGTTRFTRQPGSYQFSFGP